MIINSSERSERPLSALRAGYYGITMVMQITIRVN